MFPNHNKQNLPNLQNHPTNALQTNTKSNIHKQFTEGMMSLENKRNNTQNKYEQIIASLEDIVQKLLKKNDFLTKDRDILLKQNLVLKKHNESLYNVLEVKQRLGESQRDNCSQIFQILIENNSLTGIRSKIQQSVDEGSVSNILASNEHILNKHEFIIVSNGLSAYASQNQENQISMSNIGRPINKMSDIHLQTPGLAQENIYIQCNSKKPEGIIRAFYLSILQKKQTVRRLIKLLDELKNDITTILYEPFPTNEFWTDMLSTFIRGIHEGHFQTQSSVLEYIKTHRLIDQLMIKCLSSRIQFLFQNSDSFSSPTISQILGSLANSFGLRMQVYQNNQFLFFTKEARDDLQEQNLLLSDRASLQISLNNKSQNKYYVKQQQPCFVILERYQFLQFSFYVAVQNDVALSHYQIKEEYQPYNHSFQYSEENKSMIEKEIIDEEEDHLANVALILNQRDMNVVERRQKKHLTRYIGHRRSGKKDSRENMFYEEPLSSQRFFLNRVASKGSSPLSND